MGPRVKPEDDGEVWALRLIANIVRCGFAGWLRAAQQVCRPEEVSMRAFNALFMRV